MISICHMSIKSTKYMHEKVSCSMSENFYKKKFETVKTIVIDHTIMILKCQNIRDNAAGGK